MFYNKYFDFKDRKNKSYFHNNPLDPRIKVGWCTALAYY